VIEEAFPNGRSRPVVAQTIQSEASAGGLATILKIQKVAGTSYFDAAGFRGRTVGLEEQKAAER